MEMKDVLKQVALQNGVSEEEVREEMKKAIHETYLQKAPAFVETYGDREPTVEEFLENTVRQVNKRMSN